MLEIIALVVAMAGISRFARGRGVKPVLAISVALCGYLAIRFLASWVLAGRDSWLIVFALSWAWVGLVAGFIRFVTGARHPKPDGRWACKHCLYPNGDHAVVCEACQEPWAPAEA